MQLREGEKIQENAEIATLFEQLETYAKNKPDVFAFFCKKYEQILYDNFDWAYALFHSGDKPVGILDKYLPYINMALLLFMTIMFLIRK